MKSSFNKSLLRYLKVSLLMFILLLSSCETLGIQNVPTPSLGAIQVKTKIKTIEGKYDVTEEDVQCIADIHQREGEYEISPLKYENETLLYLCNFEEGWMIISGDKRTKPILAESRSGHLDLEQAPQGLLVWLDSMADDIYCIKRDAPEQDTEHTKLWSFFLRDRGEHQIKTKIDPVARWYAVTSQIYTLGAVDTDYVSHLIPTQWGQEFPWNKKCPTDTKVNHKCFLGCLATAIGQLLYFTHFELGKPQQLYHTIVVASPTVYGSTQNIGFSRSNPDANSTRWNDMALNRLGANYNDTVAAVRYVGDLMLDIGNRFDMHYSGSESGADMDVSTLSTEYGISCSYGDYNYSDVRTNIENGLPVLISAYSTKKLLGLVYADGHIWLMDGIHYTTRHYFYTKHFEYSENWEQYDEVYDSFEEIQQIYGIQTPSDEIPYDYYVTTQYLLMNWGYDGSEDDGYYGIGASDYWNANGHNHQYLRTIYYGFH